MGDRYGKAWGHALCVWHALLFAGRTHQTKGTAERSGRARVAMTTIGVTATVLVLGIATAHTSQSRASASPQAPVTARELAGVWDGQYSVSKGKPPFQLGPGRVSMSFVGTKLLATGVVSPEERELSFTVNANTNPKQLDYWVSPTQKFQSVYEVIGDTLKIALMGANEPRPKTLESTATNGVVLLVLKKRG